MRVVVTPSSANSGALGAPVAAGAGNAGGKFSGARAAKLALSTQSIIFTADMTIRVKDVTATASRVTGIAAAVGGYVAGEREMFPQLPDPRLRRADPAGHVDDLLGDVLGLTGRDRPLKSPQ